MADTGKRLLWVVGAGGPPFEYALPKLARRADVYALLATGISDLQRGLLGQWCTEVIAHEPGEPLADGIVRNAQRVNADGVIAFSEFAVVAVAQACLRLGLPGPGANVRYARDKWLMRQRWAQAGLPEPRFMKVSDVADLAEAARVLRKPFLLKSSGRGGGIGQQVIDTATSLPRAIAEVDVALRRAAEHGIVEYSGDLDVGHLVAEEIIESTTESWYPDARYGDFLSVEGVVAGGVYHPLCLTGRLPTLPPFAEIGAVSPCVLREDLQRKVEELAVQAVTALGLSTCATHTEVKLAAGERMWLLETAARPGGSTATTLAEAVFGVDVVGLAAGEALGEPGVYPERMLTSGDRAAASIFLFAANSAGKPWAGPVPFHWQRLDWAALVSAASRVEVMPSQMVPDGTVVSPYQPGSGALNYMGSVCVHSPDPETLLSDCYRLVDGLEAALLGMGSR